MCVDVDESHECAAECGSRSEKCEFCEKFCCPSSRTETLCNVLNMFRVTDPDINRANVVCEPDDVPAFLVVDYIGALSAPLCHFFNLILASLWYPSAW